MPTYRYTCPKCGRVVDVERPMRESGEPIICAVCAAKDDYEFVQMRRVYTPPIVRLPGQGQSSLGNQHSAGRDQFDEDVRAGKLPYEDEELIY